MIEEFSPSERLVEYIASKNKDNDDNNSNSNDEVIEVYNAMPDECRTEISEDELREYLRISDPDVRRVRVKIVNSGFSLPMIVSVREINRITAISILGDLSSHGNIEPGRIDLLIAYSRNFKTYKIPRSLDPYSYATNGMAQSYDTIGTNGLFSTRTVGKLTGDSVHFMMFAAGRNSMKCKRFSFGGNLLLPPTADRPGDTPPAVREGDPCAIDEEFCKNTLGLEIDQSFQEHALRLAMIQDIVKDKELKFSERNLQDIFCNHWLSTLVQSIDTSDDLRVVDVTGMNPLDVHVEVCNEYLISQGKNEISGRTGLQVELSIKSDAVVCPKNYVGNANGAFENCAYHIEMKEQNSLKCSGLRPKSQLLAESLAKSIELLQVNLALPSVLYSVLCDGFSLYVLIHFPPKNTAYLSRREIEPGRMTCVMAWLQQLSANKDLTEEQFLGMGFKVESNDLESDVTEQVKKAGEAREKRRIENDANENNQKKSATKFNNKGLVIDVVADEEFDRQAKLQKKSATFCHFQNYYRYNDPLPLTEDVLDSVHENQPLTAEEKLGRAGFYMRTAN